MKVSIVTINYKKPSLTIACMKSLFAVYEKQFETGEYELIIVDNHSEDNSVTLLKRTITHEGYKHVFLLENKQNSGFGGGNNLGAAKAKGEYILFLNNDTFVKEGLEKMVAFMTTHKDAGIVGGPLRNFDKTMQPSSGRFFSVGYIFLLLLGLQRLNIVDKNPSTTSQVDWVKGALLMIQKSLFEKLHGFDERIFMYTEDMELCYRAREKGYSVYFYPDVTVFHEDQGSSNRSFAIIQIYRGIAYFFKKHKKRWEYLLVKLLLQTKAIFLVIYGKLSKNRFFVETYEKALAAL